MVQKTLEKFRNFEIIMWDFEIWNFGGTTVLLVVIWVVKHEILITQ